VERPESEIVTIEIVKQGTESAGEKVLRGFFVGGQEIVVYAPKSPDESVQNVRRRRDDVFLEPEVAGFVGESNTAISNLTLKTHEGALSGLEIARLSRLFMSPNQHRDSLPLRQC